MKLSKVTVYKRKGSIWDRLVFGNAHIKRTKAVLCEEGMSTNDSLTVRIFSPSARVIEPGDKIVEGNGADLPDETALTVTEVSDNCEIMRAHIRVTAH